MSNYESEWGSFKVPAADFARLRQAFEKEARRRQETAYEETQTFWKSLSRKQQTDWAAYGGAKRDYVSALYRKNAKAAGGWGSGAPGSHGSWSGPGSSRIMFADDNQAQHCNLVDDMLSAGEYIKDGHHRLRATAPRRVQKGDIDFANNRTITFNQGQSYVGFHKDDNRITYTSGDNNHAKDTADAEWLKQMLDRELNSIRWTRGTGGVMQYRSEYDDEYGDEWGRGDEGQASRGIGPLGHEHAPQVAEDYTDSKGVRHSGSSTRASHMNAQWKAQEAYEKSFQQSRGKTTAASNSGSYSTKRLGSSGPVHLG